MDAKRFKRRTHETEEYICQWLLQNIFILFKGNTTHLGRFMYMWLPKLICIPIVKCEVLGTQHSSSLMSITWVRCKDNIYVLSWFSPVLIEAQSWRKLRGRFTTWDLSATVVHKMLFLCLLAHIHLWASQSSEATTLSSQVSSHQYAALQQGRGEKAMISRATRSTVLILGWLRCRGFSTSRRGLFFTALALLKLLLKSHW